MIAMNDITVNWKPVYISNKAHGVRHMRYTRNKKKLMKKMVLSAISSKWGGETANLKSEFFSSICSFFLILSLFLNSFLFHFKIIWQYDAFTHRPCGILEFIPKIVGSGLVSNNSIKCPKSSNIFDKNWLKFPFSYPIFLHTGVGSSMIVCGYQRMLAV